MKNPFIYGEAVKGEHFADRRNELREIVRDLKSGERIFLISPRRYGKTSLILNVLDKLKSNNFYTVYLDLYKATSLQKLLELYAREVARAVESKIEKMFNFLKDTLPGLRPSIYVQPDGTTTIGIEHTQKTSDTFKFLDQMYDLPQNIAKRKGNHFVVVFDEFQEIRNFNGESIEKAMRASFQHHDKVSYLFAGSKRHVLYDMVSNPDRAFYKMGRIINLHKLPRNEFADFLRNAFTKTGFTVEKETIHTLLDVAEDYPYNAQYLCHKLWDDFSDIRRIESKDVEPALERILTETTPVFLSIWDNLSLQQRRLLQAISVSGGDHLFTQDFIILNNLGSAATVQTSLKLLMKKQILDKENATYFFTDVFFREWIKRKI